MTRIQTLHRYWLLLLLLSVLTIGSTQAQNIVYVDADATGANDGSSWQDAFTYLGDAILVIDAEIWVAEGTYYPAPTGNLNPNFTFVLRGDMELYGGFSGVESLRSQRDPVQNLTILSGDIDRNDLSNPATDYNQIVGTNSYHVVFYSAGIGENVVLDGFTITGGRSDIGSAEYGGGGMVFYGSNITPGRYFRGRVQNCIFSGNQGIEGGAIKAFSTNTPIDQEITIENCEFLGNGGYSFLFPAGGAVCFKGSTNSLMSNRVRNCTFIDNESEWSGGAIYIRSFRGIDNNLIENCQFIGNQLGRPNQRGSHGGAIMYEQIRGSGKLSIHDCLFSQNTGGDSTTQLQYTAGGAMSMWFQELTDSSELSIRNCSFQDNQFVNNGFGAGIAIINYSASSNSANHFLTTEIDSCDFSNNGQTNSSTSETGAIYYHGLRADGSLQVSNSTFVQNYANRGGGLHAIADDAVELVLQVENCLFADNEAGSNGGGIWIGSNAQNNPQSVRFRLQNNQFQDNQAQSGAGVMIAATTGSNSQIAVTSSQNEFDGNEASFNAGGLALVTDDLAQLAYTSRGDQYVNNGAFTQGAGFYAQLYGQGNHNLLINDASFQANQSLKGPALLIKSDGSSQNQIALSRVKVAGDSAGISGPIFLQNIRGNIEIDNLLMHDNYALSSGGAIYATTQYNTNLNLANCTFTQNQSSGIGDVLYLEGAINGSLDVEIANSILWNNDNGDEISSHGNVNANYSYSILESTVNGQSILNLDPLFLDPANQDFQLDWTSPAIDAGNPLANTSLTDLNNNPRVQGTGIDLGAYESPFTTSLENTTQSRISFFPNPSQGQISIDLSSFQSYDEVKVKLYDPLGKLIFEDRFAERSSESLAVDFGKLSAGLFLLTVQVSEQSYSQNLIIH